MIKVNSAIKMNWGRIRELEKAQIITLEQTAEYLHTEVVQAQVVPRMDGNLQGESFFVDNSESKNGKTTLVHNTPYARRLYFHPEYHFHKEPWEDEKGRKHDGNPNAKGKWFEDWLPGGSKKNDCKEAFKQFYKRNARV